MAKWTEVTVSSEGFRLPDLCPGCLRPAPDTSFRVQSEKGRLKGFYLVGTKWEHMWITVSFCGKCADRRKRWEKRDLVLLFISAIAAFAFAGAVAAVASRLGLWEPLMVALFWGVFFGAAVALTILSTRLTDYRAVRVKGHTGKTITFAFSNPEYAREFALANVRTGRIAASQAS